MLNVVGQTRLHDAFWVEQPAKQASELSASRYLPIVSVLASALDRTDRKNTTTAAAEAILIAISPRLVRPTLFDFKRGGKVGFSGDPDHQKPNVVRFGRRREHDRRVVAESEIKTRRFYGAAALFSIVASHWLTNIPAQPNVIATAPPAIFSMAPRIVA